jgi:phage/plasmid-associated DNA primase
MTLRKRPDWVSDADWAAYKAGSEPAAKSNGEKPSEDCLALTLVDRHGTDFQYDVEIGKWTRWDRRVWAQERTLALFDLARKTCRNPNPTEDKTQ